MRPCMFGCCRPYAHVGAVCAGGARGGAGSPGLESACLARRGQAELGIVSGFAAIGRNWRTSVDTALGGKS
jgi:hypothetical protein